jgi:hypothetical protein
VPIRFGPFHFVYTQREQAQRTVLAHLIEVYGINGARLRINHEAHAAAWRHDIHSEQHEWWFDLKTMHHNLEHSLAWGRGVGL